MMKEEKENKKKKYLKNTKKKKKQKNKQPVEANSISFQNNQILPKRLLFLWNVRNVRDVITNK